MFQKITRLKFAHFLCLCPRVLPKYHMSVVVERLRGVKVRRLLLRCDGIWTKLAWRQVPWRPLFGMQKKPRPWEGWSHPPNGFKDFLTKKQHGVFVFVSPFHQEELQFCLNFSFFRDLWFRFSMSWFVVFLLIWLCCSCVGGLVCVFLLTSLYDFLLFSSFLCNYFLCVQLYTIFVPWILFLCFISLRLLMSPSTVFFNHPSIKSQCCFFSGLVLLISCTFI